MQILKDLARLGIESEICSEKSRILDFSRKKTTQKVNLYEKVQIPGYNEAILKIKRYLEDEENLSKASQKIVKNRDQILHDPPVGEPGTVSVRGAGARDGGHHPLRHRHR